MTIQSLTPCLAFNGNCASAIALYESALGATVAQVVRYSDANKMGQSFDEAQKDWVMWGVIKLGEGEISVMDAPPSRRVPEAGNVSVFLNFSDVASLEKSFRALGEGGHVITEVNDTFWGARFGMLQDRFGVRWMLSHEVARP